MFRFFIGGMLVTATIIVLAGCDISNQNVIGDQLSKVRSPNRKAIAVVTRANPGNATTPFVYRVYIMANQHNKNPLVVLKVSKTIGLNVKWKNSTNLTISMECGEIFSYMNAYPLFSANSAEQIDAVLMPTKPCTEKQIDSGP